jgi:predicted Rossmann fold nucleotide-binding protein DprA/Smf involved in DNA uptake
MLIREGARIVTSAEEILEDLALKDLSPLNLNTDEPGRIAQLPGMSEEKSLIWKIISDFKKPVTVDNISETAKLEPYVVNRELAHLILEGYVAESNGKFIIKGK